MSEVGTPVPPRRTVRAEGTGDTADWWLEMRSDFSARMLEDLTSGEPLRVLHAADQLVIDHNLPGPDGTRVVSILDAVPVLAVHRLVMDALSEIGKIPNP